MAKRARPSDLGPSIAPSFQEERPTRARRNGDGYVAVPDIGPQIAEYAFLSDCEVNCLVAPSGRVEWMCLPRADSPSVFASMLDRAAGSFRFGPSGVSV